MTIWNKTRSRYDPTGIDPHIPEAEIDRQFEAAKKRFAEIKEQERLKTTITLEAQALYFAEFAGPIDEAQAQAAEIATYDCWRDDDLSPIQRGEKIPRQPRTKNGVVGKMIVCKSFADFHSDNPQDYKDTFGAQEVTFR